MRGNRQPPHPHQRGFALLIMLVIVMMGVLYLAVNGASIVGMKEARLTQTGGALLQAKEALIGYAATYRDNHPGEIFGYLPCPDIDGDGVSDTLNSSGECKAAGQTTAGLLPYRTLGLSDLRDENGVCLWYVVSGAFKASTTKTEPMNWDTQGGIQLLDSGGNAVLSPDDPNGGAAAVVIAAGPPLAGQNRTSSGSICGVPPISTPADVSAYIESTVNAAGTTTVTQGDVYVGGNLVNNDRMLSITPKDIFDRIASRSDFKNALTASPAGWINTLTDKIRIAIETQIQNQLDTTSAGPIAPSGVAMPSNQAAYTQFAGKQIGDVATIAFTNPIAPWFANWSNQFRQVACTDISTPCLTQCLEATAPCPTLSQQQCRGALLFGGRYLSSPGVGGPRPSGVMSSGTANLGAFFEAAQGLDILNGASTVFRGQSGYTDPNNSDIARAQDVGVCLFPGTFLSFNNGIGSFIAKSSLATNAPVAIDTVAKTITLGNTAASGFNSGCAWAPPIPFATSLRAYFTFNILDRGEGFVFAVADADPTRNSPSGFLCGDGGAAMGYAGSGLNYPKIGLEIDTRREALYGDPGTSLRPDHIAFVYWGTAASAVDDNVHGLPAAGTVDGTQPLNPRGLGTLSVSGASWAANVATITTASAHYLIPNQLVTITGINPSGFNGTRRVTPTGATTFTFSLNIDPGSYVSGGTTSSPFHGIATVKSSDALLPYDGVLPLNTDIHVRIDITRSHGGASGTYHLAAYVVSAPEPEGVDSSCVTLSNLRNLSFDMESLACAHGPTVSQDGIVIDDIPGFAAALSSVYAGFTNGQRGTTVASSAAGEQDITISNFLMRVQ